MSHLEKKPDGYPMPDYRPGTKILKLLSIGT